MRFLILFVLLVSLLPTTIISFHQVNITKDGELEHFLCSGQPLVQDTIAVLSTNLTHKVASNISSCLINTSYSLTLASDSSLKVCIIQCEEPSRVFTFTNLHSLTLQRLILKGCGGHLDATVPINSTSSGVYFTQYQSAVFMLLNINILSIDEVQIAQYYGFAILAINPLNAFIKCIEVCLSKTKEDIGSGILLLFTDSSRHLEQMEPSNITIQEARMYNNTAIISIPCCLSYLKGDNKGPLPIVHGSGLTVYYTQQQFTVNLLVGHSNFYNNSGSLAGAIMIFHYNNAKLSSSTKISNAIFWKNYNLNYCTWVGASVSFVDYFSEQLILSLSQNGFEPLSLSHCQFIDHGRRSVKIYSIINIVSINPPQNNSFKITFKNVSFIGNVATCLFATASKKSKRVQLVFKDTVAQFQYHGVENLAFFVVSSIYKLFLIEHNNFSNNLGGVFNVTNTIVVLQGNLVFTENEGKEGAAFSLYGKSRFKLCNGLRATFSRNTATKSGGAIFALDSDCSHNCNCMFQADKRSNISMIFKENYAAYSGNSIISSDVYNCSINHQYYTALLAKKFFLTISNGTLNNSLSTFIANVCFYYEGNCSKFNNTMKVYPGQVVYIPLQMTDGFGRDIYSVVSFEIISHKKIKSNMKYKIQVISWKLSNIISTKLNAYTLFQMTFTKIRSWRNIHNSSLSIIAKSGYGSHKIPLSIPIVFLNCPIGFEFNDVMNNCTCDNIFKKLKFQPVCKISSHLFNNNSNPLSTISRYYLAGWIGLINLTSGTTVFGAAKSCHLFCYLDSIHNLFLINGTDIKITNKDLTDAVPLCTTNRRGPLCSQCSPGYSVVFGSIQCSKCSNWWLLTILVYLVAGPLFIYLLYALRLTLTTGTINGIVFYAQMLVTYNQFNLRSRNFISVFYSISNGLISLLNLSINFNYPICLYNGMTEVWKFALNLVFPIYLMMIVVLLIIISRYSVKLSNEISQSSIQVLVTVVHLSFSSFLISAQNVYTYSIIHLNTTDVPLHIWLRDGTTEYGSGSHLALIIMTSLIVWPILIIYIGMLLFGRLVMRINRLREYLRPVYEAIHAPYKDNREFFFSAQLLIVLLSYILYCQVHEEHFSSFCMFAVMILIIYTFSAALFPPYKASWLNYLNLIILIITLLIALLIWYLFFISDMDGLMLAFNSGTVLILLIFFVVLIGHVLWVRGKLKKLNLYLKARYYALCQNSKRIFPPKKKQLWLNIEDSFFDSYSETREPLLSP